MNRANISGDISNVTNHQDGQFWLQTGRGDFVMCHLAPFFREGFAELQNGDSIMIEGSVHMMGRVNTSTGAGEGWVWVTQIEAIKPAQRAKKANQKWKEAMTNQVEAEFQGADIVPRLRKAESDRYSLEYELNTVRREAADAILRAVAGEN